MGVSYLRIQELGTELNSLVGKEIVDVGNALPTGLILEGKDQSILKRKRRENRRKIKEIQNSGTLTGSKANQDFVDSLTFQNNLINGVRDASREARVKKRDEIADKRIADRKARKAERDRVNAELAIKQDQKEQERIDREIKELQAQRLAIERAGPEGISNLGMKQHMDTVMPPSARAKANAINKPEPIIGEVTENLPRIDVTKAPSVKSNIDTLSGSLTAERKNLNKIFANGSPAAIKKTFESPEVQASNPNVNNAEVAEVVKEIKATTSNPFVQQAFKDIGMSQEEITEVNKQIDTATDVVANTVVNLKKEKTVDPQKLFAAKQFRQLGNPMGSPGVQVPKGFNIDNPNPLATLQAKVSENPFAKKIAEKGGLIAEGASALGIGVNTEGLTGKFGGAMEAFANGANPIKPGNPFGSLGVEFGNIMASVVGLVNGVGSFGELGKSIPSLPNGFDIQNQIPAPNLVQETGKTQLAKVVNKGTKTAVEEPTTPVKKLTESPTTGIDALGYNQLDNDFFGGYEPVNSKKEFELEIKNSPRVIKHLLVNWNLSAENEFYDGRKLNEWHHKFFTNITQGKGKPKPEPIGRIGYARTNYIIKKDGGLERVIPIGTAPTTFFKKRLFDPDKEPFQKVHDEGIMVTFDAGLLGDQPAYRGIASVNLKQDWNNVSSKSITSEQWKTFDMIIDVMYRHSPGGMFKGYDKFLAEQRMEVSRDEAGATKMVQISRFMELIGPEFDVGTYLLKKRGEVPDADDGEDDPYADLTDEYLNSDEDVE